MSLRRPEAAPDFRAIVLFSIRSCMRDHAVPAELHDKAALIETLRLRIGRIGGASAGSATNRPAIRFGLHAVDAHLPDGGLAAGALHEVGGSGPDTEHGTLPSLLVAGLLAGHQRSRQVLWAMRDDDLFAPGLAAVGLGPNRLILARCGGSVLAVMEEALRHPGLAAVVGEVWDRLDLTASRRLQLAAEASGVVAFAIRRSRRHDDPRLLAPSAAVSRWRVAAAPACRPAEPFDQMPDRMPWRLQLLRCRGTPFASHWTLQARDARHPVVPEPAVPEPIWRLADPAPAPDRPSVAAALADRPARATGWTDSRPRLRTG